ncbi:ribosome biogenesis GTP-binding protein YihA/YsxC [Arsenophonus endosymbiont of Aleurodicus dispersus]|uniref:ribosome biogenesis GTP-binding protein YihA/YsxC n=1 Tax=Arsenophonus endosymbiont of Aleurodicus dispersus TaxID=235559 RepID=UPI000EAEA4E7|nr:ribosome biogenesis GTP-binding protein YihA/YsxC [Arsenophonus endosymbiont of Aleurodicus dispersus]
MTNKNYNYHQTKFIISAPDISQLPKDHGIEIALAGHSNAGKSSTLNALTQQKNLARTSKTPGRTQLINLFEVAEGIRLVDLPGYGYAEVTKSIKYQWQQALVKYLQKRKCLKGLIILMDIRHPLKNMDIQIIEWSIAKNRQILILLNKADKLVSNQQKYQVIAVRNRLKKVAYNIQVEPFSSLKKIGVDKLQLTLDEWFVDN